MGHYTGTAYKFKLNEEDSSYEDILVNMQEEIDKKYIEEEKNPGESFGASMSVKNGIVSYSSGGYKSRVSHRLSYELIKKIQKNINTNPDVCYGYTIEENESIEGLNGYAKKIGQYFFEAGYANSYNGYIGIYNPDSIDLFKKCLENNSLLEEVIRKGEGARLKTELFTEKNEINEYNFYQKKTPDSTQYEINEKWLVYWLIYGTEDKYNTDFNYYSNARMNLKEYLFALDYKHYDNHKGIKVLKDLTRYGVLFKEGLDSIEGNFKLGVRYDASGHDISKEKIETWYQENKENFTEIPKISKTLANYLKENYPETFLKLKENLIELHNTPKGMRKMSNIQYWSGDTLDKLAENEVFVFGSNPLL